MSHKKRLYTLLIPFLLLMLVLGACSQPAAQPAEEEAPATEEVMEEATEEVAGEEAPAAEEAAEEAEAPAEEAAGEEAFSVTVTDGLGNEVTLDARPMRIASATLGTDEILLDLVGPERLIAVTNLASDPTISNIADRPELEQIENQVEADPEQIIALEPDLVFVASFTDPAVIEQLQGAGVPVFVMGFFNSIDSIEQNILTIGELVGEPERAEEIVADMNATLDEVAAQVAEMEGEPPTALYLSSGGWVAGSATTVDDIITRAGGVNAAADLVDWNQVSEETIIEMDPDVVILSPYVTDEEFVDNPVFAGLSAVVNERVFVANDAHLSAVSQYVALGVEDVFEMLYLVPVSE